VIKYTSIIYFIYDTGKCKAQASCAFRLSFQLTSGYINDHF
jgi:hypothetical protein